VTLSRHTSALISEITPEMDNCEVVIAGMVNGVRTLVTKAGKPFVAVAVEDLSGSTEVTVWPDVYEPTRPLWAPGNILLMLVRVRERGDRLQAAVQQVSLVQAADGSVSHEQFEIPAWLRDALRTSADVSVSDVQHDTPADPTTKVAEPATNGSDGAAKASRAATNGAATATAPPARRPARPLRFILHESDDHEADRARLDALIELLKKSPGSHPVRLFIHAGDGDRIELSMPDAAISEELREAGIAALGANGDAEPLPQDRRTVGVQPLEV
jgi:hypothetical protein